MFNACILQLGIFGNLIPDQAVKILEKHKSDNHILVASPVSDISGLRGEDEVESLQASDSYLSVSRQSTELPTEEIELSPEAGPAKSRPRKVNEQHNTATLDFDPGSSDDDFVTTVNSCSRKVNTAFKNCSVGVVQGIN